MTDRSFVWWKLFQGARKCGYDVSVFVTRYPVVSFVKAV
jgi:hypothetical protein